MGLECLAPSTPSRHRRGVRRCVRRRRPRGDSRRGVGRPKSAVTVIRAIGGRSLRSGTDRCDAAKLHANRRVGGPRNHGAGLELEGGHARQVRAARRSLRRSRLRTIGFAIELPRMMDSRWMIPIAALAAVACSSSSKGGNDTLTDGGSSRAADGGTHTTTDAGGDSGSKRSDGGNDTGTSPHTPDASTGGGPGLLTCTDSSAVTTADAGPSPAPGVLSGMTPGPGTFVGGCRNLPGQQYDWNVDVSSSKPRDDLDHLLWGFRKGTHLHPDLGGWSANGPYGIPIQRRFANGAQSQRELRSIKYASRERYPGPQRPQDDRSQQGAPAANGVTSYPIPDGGPKIEWDPGSGQTPGDDHLLVIQQGATCGAPCTLWETWSTLGGSSAPWTAANGARWDLGSNELRTVGWTSADAAGLISPRRARSDCRSEGEPVTYGEIRVTFNGRRRRARCGPPRRTPPARPRLGGHDPLTGLPPPVEGDRHLEKLSTAP